MAAFMSRDQFDFVAPLVEAGARTYINTFRDAYRVLRTSRPVGWDTGNSGETETAVETGFGHLLYSGPGVGDTADAVIVNLSPFRFRLPGTTGLTSNDVLEVGGRRFLVESVAAMPQFDGLVVEASLQRREGD